MLICYDPYVGTLGRFPRAEVIKMVAEAGYEGINIPVREPFIDGTDEKQIDETEKMLSKFNLRVPSVGFGNHIVTTPALREQAIEYFKIVLNVAKRMNSKIIAIWPNQPENTYVEDALETLSANLREMLLETSKAGIVLALEFEKGCPLDNYIQSITFINETDKRIRLTCDTYHLNNYKADPYRSVIAMGELIGDVHISGSHRGEPGSEGDKLDYKSFMKGLVEIGYKGPLTMQYHLKDTESIARAYAFTKKLRDNAF
jgi:D-psicose/D-tagatose/L-ribulose 3-epimerase